MALRLANSLLSDVLVAAGGIERTIFRLRQTAEELKDFADQHGVRGTAELPQKGLADFASIDAAYAFADLLSWVRNLDERLDRRAFEKGVKRRQGLLPALQLLRLRKHVQHAVDAFRAGPGGDSRDLANFTLHTALVRNPLSGVEVDQAGQICLPIPDTPGHPIYHWDLLSWKGRRDGFVFAEEVWEAVQILVDELLGAFEKAVPKRLRS